MNTQTDFTNMTGMAEETHMQEQTSLHVEDTSLPAEQILVEQNAQDGRASLFVP
jgi:hypothetical protein